MTRNQAIDLIRGTDLIFMILFNYSVTLDYFRIINTPSDFLYSFVFPRAIASIFIFISGVAAYISYSSRKKNFRERYFMRGVKLLIFAAFITLFTYIFVPEKTIYFGILHFFAVSSFLVPFIIKCGRFNLIAGMCIILPGLYLQLTEFDISYLFWLGFTPVNFSTFDYFPLIPWLGVLLLGIFSGKYIIERTAGIRFRHKSADVLTFFGKNSLTVYLVHQPVLIFILILMGFRLF